MALVTRYLGDQAPYFKRQRWEIPGGASPTVDLDSKSADAPSSTLGRRSRLDIVIITERVSITQLTQKNKLSPGHDARR